MTHFEFEVNMIIENIFLKWENKLITDQEMALSFFVYFHQMKYPNKKLNSFLEKGIPSFEILDQFNFKKVKSKAIVSLKKWLHNEWNFILLNYIPTPYQVLEFQSKGIRPVTIKIQKTLKPILNRQDCLEFFLHDLEHGHMFFFDESLKNMQINFFKKINESRQTDFWNKYLCNDEFKEKFNYLISDMNTHKEHYRQFLSAIVPVEEKTNFDFLF